MCDIFLYHYQQTLKQSFGIVGGKDLVSLCTAWQQPQYHNEKWKIIGHIGASFFFWFAKNYSLWLYPKYFMSSENLTKYYLTISLKWKGWTFPANLVQIFSAKNRSWCDVSNKTISYVILYVWKALSEVRFYILDSSQVLFGEPSFGLSLITDNFYSAAIIVWMLTLMTWRVSVMQKYSQCAALPLIVANKEAGMNRPDHKIVNCGGV